MPYKIGTDAIRRTIKYLDSGKLVFRKNVKVMMIHYDNDSQHSQGARDFVHWNLPQVLYKNPDVQCLHEKNMFPTPFVRCWLESGEDVIMDVFGKTNVQILDQLVKILGKPEHEKEADKTTSEIQLDISNFGSGCARHCMCEIPGQVPCPVVVNLPKHMTGKYKFENMAYPKKGLYKI